MLIIFLALLPTLVALACILQVLLCTLALPMLCWRPQRPSALDRQLGLVLHVVAYFCALMRLPCMIGPFLGKRGFFWLLPAQAKHLWHHPALQLLRVAGEGINLLLVAAVLQASLPLLGSAGAPLLALVVGSELLRLAAQKGQMFASASWQALPHQGIARFANHVPWLARSGYCRYYQCADAVRLRYLRTTIRRMVGLHPLAARRLAYLHAFRIVPDSHPLRSGYVRDIARGDVFIHRRWTNDPWLLVGLAFRRAPWMFDPRELPRPFGYRSAANRITTSFVLCHARFSPSFAWYQFGHEIKAASHDIVLRALRLAGCEREATLRGDGTYPFEQDAAEQKQDVLWTNAAALLDIRRRHALGEQLTALEIAEQYAYPYCYVVEVLMLQLPCASGTHTNSFSNVETTAKSAKVEILSSRSSP